MLQIGQYTIESSNHKGLRFSNCLTQGYACPAVVDGKVIVRNVNTLDMLEGISPSIPCTSTIRLNRCKSFLFRIYFAASSGKEYFLLFDEFFPEESGIFLDSGVPPSKLYDLSEIVRNTKNISSLDITIECRNNSFAISLGNNRFDITSPEPVHRALLKFNQLPSVQLMGIPSTLVDRVVVSESLEDGTSKTIAEGDFLNVPFFCD